MAKKPTPTSVLNHLIPPVSEQPEDAADLLRQADRCREDHRLDEAESLCRRVLALRPDHPDAYHILALTALESGHAGAALANVDRAIAGDDRAAPYHATRGLVLAGLQRPDEAEAALRRSVALSPDYVHGHYNLAILFSNDGRLEEALESLRAVVALTPRNPFAHANMGVALAQLDRPAEAEEAMRRAVDLAPDLPLAIHNLTAFLLSRDRPEEAQMVARRGIDAGLDDVQVHYGLGLALQRQGAYGEASAAFQRVLDLDPGFDAAHQRLDEVAGLMK